MTELTQTKSNSSQLQSSHQMGHASTHTPAQAEPTQATSVQPTLSYEDFERRLKPHLNQVYDRETVDATIDRIYHLLSSKFISPGQENVGKWDESKILLITYGDSIRKQDSSHPLSTLNTFLSEQLSTEITGVHILPFSPYSSDDGFAVIDYLSVNPDVGDWDDIGAIAQNFELMVDLVINHISSEHEWFQQFKAGKTPGCDYFIEVDPNTDTSEVVRPRSSPLLVETPTPDGIKHVWATFSADQIDVDFSNPDVLLEYIKIIMFYVEAGAKYIRLDAIGFLWKKLGTPCIHLPETHAMIRALREILQVVDPSISLITETNVPNKENLSYFGNRNEAHMIYNFSLPPLLLNALLQGRAEHLKTWMMSMPPAPLGCCYFNFTASHDGIGLRPTEGLLKGEEYDQLIEAVKAFGGKISMRKRSDGSESPYEMNISLFDAMKGTVNGPDEWQVERFICSQTIMMSLEGIPAFYIHSLLATPNDNEGMAKTGRNRSINRHSWDYERLRSLLNDPDSAQAQIFNELRRLIRIRQQQGAFHPEATQYTLQPMNPAIFAFWRQSTSRDQSIFSIHNLSDRPQELSLNALNLIVTDPWCDLINGDMISETQTTVTLKPYQSRWITNKHCCLDSHVTD